MIGRSRKHALLLPPNPLEEGRDVLGLELAEPNRDNLARVADAPLTGADPVGMPKRLSGFRAARKSAYLLPSLRRRVSTETITVLFHQEFSRARTRGHGAPPASAAPARPWPGSSCARSGRAPARARRRLPRCGRRRASTSARSQSASPCIVERVCAFRDRDRLARERFGLGMLAAVSVDERLHLPPEHLRREVLLVAELAAELRERLRLVVASERAQRATERRRVRRQDAARRSRSSSQLAILAKVSGRSLVVAGESRDLRRATSIAIRRRSARDRSLASRAIAHASSKRPSIASSCGAAQSVPDVDSRAATHRASAAPRLPGAGPRQSAMSRPKSAPAALPGEPRVTDRLLGRLRLVLKAAAEVSHPTPSAIPDARQSGVVVCLLEERQRRVRASASELVDSDRRRASARSRPQRCGQAPRPLRRRPARACSAAASAMLSCLGTSLACSAWRGRARDGRRAEAAASARAPARAAARRLDRRRARARAGRRRRVASPARSASSGSGCPSSAL